jgi:glycosyltransferase involved in cell wall biosynthesis
LTSAARISERLRPDVTDKGMNPPLVSVIVPTYNCGPFLAAALDSILSQDWQPLEVIAVDDGSTDDTLEVLRRYGDRVRLLQQPNGGPAAARNLAVRESRGEYLAFLDADDLWLPGHLRVLMSYLQAHPDIRVAYGEWLVWPADADGSYAPLAMPPLVDSPDVDPANSGWVYPALLVDSIIHIIAAVIHRSVYDAVGGFDQTLRTGSDWDFWIRVGRRFPVAKLRRPVAVYRQNPTSVTHVVRKENNGFLLLKRIVDTYGLRDEAGHLADRRAVARRLSDLAFNHAYRHYWHGDPNIAAQWFSIAWQHDPRRLKAAAYLIAATAKRLRLVPTRTRQPRLPQP